MFIDWDLSVKLFMAAEVLMLDRQSRAIFIVCKCMFRLFIWSQQAWVFKNIYIYILMRHPIRNKILGRITLPSKEKGSGTSRLVWLYERKNNHDFIDFSDRDMLSCWNRFRPIWRRHCYMYIWAERRSFLHISQLVRKSWSAIWPQCQGLNLSSFD